MSNSSPIQSRSSFALPIFPAVVAGVLVTAALYGGLTLELIDQPVLKRYCTSHITTILALGLGITALVAVGLKLQATLAQSRILRTIDRMLDKVMGEGDDVNATQRALWLEARWLALPAWQQNSWAGRCVSEVIERQIRRGHPTALENDLKDVATNLRHQQHESLSLLRIAAVVIPILGVIGSLICLSNVLVQSESLSQSGIPVSVGLGSAVAPLVVAMTMAIPLLFALHLATGLDKQLLCAIDELARENLFEFLYYDSPARQIVAREAPVVAVDSAMPSRQAIDDLLAAIHQLVEVQAGIWSRSIGEAQKQWSTWSTACGDQLREALDKSLTQHALQIEKIQQEAGRQVDSRWQQWQITLSDQARVMHAQQKELVRQTEAIDRLVTSTTEMKKAEADVYERFANFELLEQLQQTTLGVGEAVAVLATSLERAGIIRGMPVKPRSTRRTNEEALDDHRKVA